MMQITRYNYETFFLLYVDNELSAADRKAVDEFVLANPDLNIELQVLQQAVVKADEIVLVKKEWLYRSEDTTVLQENLLLYADDELTTADKQTVEVLLASDKTVQTEWDILQQTKLEPDMTIVFADKQMLYRNENGRVVSFKWWRIAAAAVLLGIVTWVCVSIYKNSFLAPAVDMEVAGNNKVKTIPPQKETIITKTISTKNTDEHSDVQQNIAAADAIKNKAEKNAGANKDAFTKDKNKHGKANTETIAIQINNNKKPGNDLPKPNFENINNNTGNKIIAANVKPENNSTSRVSGNNATVVRRITDEGITGSIVNQLNKTNTAPAIIAVANIKKGNDETGNGYLNVDNNKDKRTSLGGFLRKAKRIIERTTNVNTGEGIKVAGFEIALK